PHCSLLFTYTLPLPPTSTLFPYTTLFRSYIIGIMQHIEPAGIHSGDSYAVLPPYNLGAFVIAQMENYTEKIAQALKVKGLINIQFAIKDDKVYVIEANPRASRTVPFICKAYGEPYANYATKVMLEELKV